MYFTKLIAMLKLNFLLQLRNPTIIILMTLSPLILMPFLKPTYKSMLILQGYTHASGAEQVVPGLALLFSFLATQVIVQAFYDEHIWGTWTRLRSTAASLSTILLGKTFVAFIIQSIQLIIVLSLGSLLYNYRPNGSWLALLLAIFLFCAVLTALSVCLSLWIKSEKSALSIGNLIGMVMSGIGGALGSTSDFPSWAQNIAKVSPVYWAMNAIHSISLDSAHLHDIRKPLAILFLFLLVFIALSIVKCLLGLDNHKTE